MKTFSFKICILVGGDVFLLLHPVEEGEGGMKMVVVLLLFWSSVVEEHQFLRWAYREMSVASRPDCQEGYVGFLL